ncbi:hypothetical protein [Bradyrhizobium sp. USDA 4545]|uniref:hypothetical protein n=1 Tax=Bradyrhizobium sp. USDA 4545 TaxID=2817705 RepID=UPI0020A558AB|nr:hypothetical protein [Bradyrhizobium sp. USDA 4545]MCP1832793.1 hypothetical protein [Bradyrhizobium sp. USDA 4545]
MPLMTIGKCFRGRKDCEAFDVVEATPPDLTEKQWQTLDFKPDSFVCCGCIKPEARKPAQDAYRVCFKNAVVDEMSDNDEQDLVHLIKVATTALAVIATRRVARGHIDVPQTFEGGMMTVNTKQGLEK